MKATVAIITAAVDIVGCICFVICSNNFFPVRIWQSAISKKTPAHENSRTEVLINFLSKSIVHHFNSTFIPSGLLAKPRYKVFDEVSHDFLTSVIICPLLSVIIICFGWPGNKTRALLSVFTGLLATKE
jgi:hypothetical protein